MAESQRWPYMLSYLAVNVPPLDVTTNAVADWNTIEKATWLLMNASTSGLIQITHIHFLSLLYPSRLEKRLILTLLVPLALVAAVMQLIPIQGIDPHNKTILVASALQNICNATLSLLFTVALFIWGLLVNRRQAWRTDGGTAVFGTAALSLAVISTALNFVYVDREAEYVWMPGLLWAVVLWQSFLGWWWWIGAGSGSGLLSTSDASELEERLRRQEKRENRRREAKESRRMTRMRAKKVLKDMFGRSNDGDSDSATTTVGSLTSLGVDGLHPDSLQTGSGQRLRRRSRTSIDENDDEEVGFADTKAPIMPHTARFQRIIPDFLLRWFASLRHAHLVAAHAQEAEQVERIRILGRRRPIRMGGWGLGSLGWRARIERSPEREGSGELGRGKEEGWERDTRERGRKCEIHEGSMPSRHQVASLERTFSNETFMSRTGRTGSSDPPRGWEPANRFIRSDPTSRSTPNSPPTVPSPMHQASMWWWGPLRRWRLQDTTVY
ncbi:hypothetical protein AX15_004331 [Amanita polypyramis BW_CC]|nr:hypothetical protein AX15_004331 [Amanita polypyramis BW_CC]